MLIVRRRTGQSISIGESIQIEILEVSPGRVKLGITAPMDVQVCRKEAELIREQNHLASQAVSPVALSQLGRIWSGSQLAIQDDIPQSGFVLTPEHGCQK